MTGINNALLQLALMLRGNPGFGGGIGSNWSGPFNDSLMQSATPPMNPMMNSWAAMPSPHQGMPGSHFPTTRAQELLLGPMNPAYEIPFQPTWEMPEFIPMPDALPLPDTGPLPPDFLPPIPFNPPLTIPDEGADDNISKYGDKPRRWSKRCMEEWADAALRCAEEQKKYYAAGAFDEPFDLERCKRGYVSAACGGNPVDYGPKGKPYKPKPKPRPKPNGFIIA